MSDAAPERRRFEPPESEAGAPYWQATRDQRFILPWCTACGRPHWFPRDACPFCLSPAIEWREASGRGEIEAVSVMPKPAMPMLADRVPCAVVLVALDEGVRMMSNAVADDPFAVAVGDPVELVWEPLSDGRHLPQFRVTPR